MLKLNTLLMNDNKTAIIYCRVSTDKQAQNWDSISIQEKECRSYCERMHIDVVEVFREQFTGTSVQRPALTEALKFLKKQKKSIDYCIIHKIDRSTRWGLGDYYEIKKQLESFGTSLKDAYGVIQDDINVVNIDNFDTNIYDWSKINPSEIAVSMSVLSAKQERSSILQRTIPQEIRNTQNGYISRQSHFGYQNKKICTEEWKMKTTYIPDPVESKWVQAMFDFRANSAISDKEIVNMINLMWFKTRSQKVWNKSKTMIIGEGGNNPLDIKQLQKTIASSVYAGIIVEKWTWNKPIRGQFQWLVSIDTFNRANRGKIEILEHSNGNVSILHWEEKLPEKITYKRTRFHSEYPFSRAIKCPHCEGHLTPNKSRSQNGKHHYYYQCTGKFWNKHKTYTVRRDDLNETVIDFLSKIEYDKEVYILFKHIVEDVWNSEKSTLECQKQDQKQNIEKLEISKDTLLKNIEKFMDFPEILKAKNDELAKLSKQIQILKNTKIDNTHDKSKEDFLSFSKSIFTQTSKVLQQEKNEERVGVLFDLFFEELPTYEKIQSNQAMLHAVFASGSKKRAIDDSLNCIYNDEKYWWQPHLESNQDKRLWRPLH